MLSKSNTVITFQRSAFLQSQFKFNQILLLVYTTTKLKQKELILIPHTHDTTICKTW